MKNKIVFRLSKILLISGLLALTISTAQAYAATCFWVGSTATWESSSNWASLAGGTPGTCTATSPAGYPDGGDDIATFTSNNTTSVALGGAISLTTLNVNTGYSGTITTNNNTFSTTGALNMASGNTATFNAGSSTITVGGNFSLTAGTFNSGTSTILLNGNNNTQTVDVQTTVQSLYNLTIDKAGTSSTVRTNSGDQLTISNNLNLTNGRIAVHGTNGEIIVSGGISKLNYASTFTGAENNATYTGMITLKATSDNQTFIFTETNTYIPGFNMDNNGFENYTFQYGNVNNTTFWGKIQLTNSTGNNPVFDNTSDANIIFNGGITVQKGTFNTGEPTETSFGGTLELSGGTINLEAPTTNILGNITVSGGTLNDTNTEIVFSGSTNSIVNMGTGYSLKDVTVSKGSSANYLEVATGSKMEVTNSLVLNTGLLSIHTLGELIYTGTSANFSYESTFSGGRASTSYRGPLSFKPSANQTFNINSANQLPGLGLINVGLTSLILNLQNTSSNNIYGLVKTETINSGSGTEINNTGNATLSFLNNINIAGGTLNTGTPSTTAISGTLTISSGTINFDATTSTTITGITTASGGTMNLNSATTTFTGATTFSGATINNASTTLNFSNTLAVSSGEFKAGSNTVNHTGAITISSTGTYNAESSLIYINGNFTKTGGTFTKGTSGVIFQGTANATLSSNTTENFYNFQINKTGATTNILTITKTGTEITEFLVSNILDLYDGRTAISTDSRLSFSGTDTNFNYRTTFEGANTSTSHLGQLTFKAATDGQNYVIDTTNTNIPGLALHNLGRSSTTLDLQNTGSNTIYGKFEIYEQTGSNGTVFTNSGNASLTFGGTNTTAILIDGGTLNTGALTPPTTTTFAGLVTASRGVINLNTTTTTFSTATIFNGATINNTSPTLNFSSTLALSGGEFKAGSNSVNHTGAVTISGTGIYSVQTSSVAFTGILQLNGGTFNAGSTTTNFNNTGTTSIDLNGGTINASTGDLIIAGGFDMDGGTFNGTPTTGTIQVAGAFNITGATSVFNAGAQLIKVAGIFEVGTSGVFNADTSTLELTGTTSNTLNIQLSQTFYKLRINAGSDTTTKTIGASDTITVTNGLELLNGKISAGTVLIAYVNNSTFIYSENFDGGNSSNAITLRPASDNIITLDIPEILNPIKTIPAFTLQNTETQDFTLQYTGTSALTIPYAFSIANSATGKAIFKNIGNGNLTFSSTCNVGTNGEIFNGTGTTIHSGALTLSGGTYNNEGTANINSTFTLTSGEFKAGSLGNTANINLAQTFSSATGTYNNQAATTTFQNTLTFSAGTIKGGTGTIIHNNELTVSGGTYDLESGTLSTGTAGRIVMSSGSINATNGNIDSNYNNVSYGAISISGGTLNAPGTGKTLSIEQNISMSAGTFNHNNGKIIMDGSAPGTISMPNFTTFYDLQINKGTDTSTVLINSITYYVANQLILTNGLLNLPNSYLFINSTGTLDYQSTFDGTSSIGSSGRIQLNFPGTVTLPNGATKIPGLTLNNAGLTVKTGGNTQSRFFGPVNISSGSTLLNEGNAEIIFESTFTLTNGTYDGNEGITRHKTPLSLSSSTANYDAGAGDVILESGGLTITNGTYNAGSANMSLLTYGGDLNINGGTFIAPGSGKTLTIKGDLEVNSTGQFVHNNGKVLFNSDVTQFVRKLSSPEIIEFYDFEINKPEAIDATAPWVLEIESDLIINNNLYLTDGYLMQRVRSDRNEWERKGDIGDLHIITVGETGTVYWDEKFDGGWAGYIKLNNAQTLNIPPIPPYYTYGEVPSLWLNNDNLIVNQTSSGTIMMSGLVVGKGQFNNTGNGNLEFGHDVIIDAGGTLVGGTNTDISFFSGNGFDYPSLQMNGGSFSTIGGNILINDILQINGGTFSPGTANMTFTPRSGSDTGLQITGGTFNAPSGTFSLGGNLIQTGGTFVPNSPIVFTGQYDNFINNSTLNKYGDIVINKTNSTNNIYLQNDLSITGDFTITKGILNTLYPLETAKNIILEGDWTLADTDASFVPNTSTVSFNGETQSIYGANTFFNLSKPHNSSLSFEPGEENKTIVNGTWTMKGTGPTDILELRSTSPGSQWYIEINGDYDIAYLDVQDSRSTYEIDARGTGSIPEALAPNNYNWLFNVIGSGIEGVTILKYSPKNQTANTTPKFRWQDISGETKYTIQVRLASSPDWSSLVMTIDDIPANSTEIDAPTALGFNNYEWRIYATDSENNNNLDDNLNGLAFEIINIVPEFNTYLYILMFLIGGYFIYNQKRLTNNEE